MKTSEHEVQKTDGKSSILRFQSEGTQTDGEGIEKNISNIITESLFESLVRSIKSTLVGNNSEANLSWLTSTLIMVGLSYGSAVVILPYTLSQLGPVTWLLYTALIISILAYCTVLLKESCVHIMNDVKDYAMMRHPYPKVAEIAVGKKFSNLVLITLYVCLVSATLAYLLLAATILNDMIPMQMTFYSEVRIWIAVCFCITLPLMLVGTYNDMKMPAIVAVSSSFIAMICVIVITLIARFHYGIETKQFLSSNGSSRESFFTIFGEITFAAAGPCLALPNIIVFVKSPERFHVSILTSHVIVFCVYVLCGTVPFAVFGTAVSPSITKTLSIFMQTTGMYRISHVCNVLLIICQVCMAAHFIMVSVLSMNPVFLSLENMMNFPINFTWKRVILRISVLIGLLLFCVAVPYFAPVLSLVGAVPETLLTVIYPIIIYWHLFKLSRLHKIVLFMVLGFATFLMVGNAIVSVANIMKAVMYSCCDTQITQPTNINLNVSIQF